MATNIIIMYYYMCNLHRMATYMFIIKDTNSNTHKLKYILIIINRYNGICPSLKIEIKYLEMADQVNSGKNLTLA